MTTAINKSTKEKNMMYYIHSIICLVIMFGFGQIPAIEPLTPLGMNLIGIFFGLLYGWVLIDIVWPSMVGLLALMLIGGMKPNAVLAGSFGNSNVVMMFFIFIFCATISYYGLSKFISLWFITRKFVSGRPWVFTATFLVSIFVLGALTSASPAAVIGWSILYGICDLCGYKKGEGYPTMMVFGILFAAQVGMSIIPFKQVPLTVMSAFETMSGVQIAYTQYMIISIVSCVILCGLFMMIAKFVFKPDMSKLAMLDTSKLDDGSLTLNHVQKIVLGFLVGLVVLLLAPNFLPVSLPPIAFLKTIGNTGICILLVTIMCIIKVDEKPLLPFKKMIDTGVSWGIILLLAAVMPLSSAISAEESGITAMLIEVLNPIFGGKPEIFFIAVIGLVACLATNFMNNGAIGVALMPFIYSYCAAAGIDPQLPVIIVVMCVHLAFLTPAASSSAALLHGNEWCETSAIWKAAPIVIIVSWLVIAIITIALGSIMF